eukprot:g45758.t1
MYIHGEDEVLEAGELKVLEKVEGMGYAPYVGGEFLDQRGKNRVEVGVDELSGAATGRDNGSTGAVRFMDFEKEIEIGDAEVQVAEKELDIMTRVEFIYMRAQGNE